MATMDSINQRWGSWPLSAVREGRVRRSRDGEMMCFAGSGQRWLFPMISYVNRVLASYFGALLCKR